MIKHEHHACKHGSLTCPFCLEKFDFPIIPLSPKVGFPKYKKPRKIIAELTKGQYRLAIALGFTLGMMAVLIWSFTVFINKTIILEENNFNNQVEILEKVKETCGTYPNKFQTIKDGFWVECGIELKSGVSL